MFIQQVVNTCFRSLSSILKSRIYLHFMQSRQPHMYFKRSLKGIYSLILESSSLQLFYYYLHSCYNRALVVALQDDVIYSFLNELVIIWLSSVGDR